MAEPFAVKTANVLALKVNAPDVADVDALKDSPLLELPLELCESAMPAALVVALMAPEEILDDVFIDMDPGVYV